jgi:hypothetical protein
MDEIEKKKSKTNKYQSKEEGSQLKEKLNEKTTLKFG